jgi:DNA-binding transcriptional LysR family regulator
MRPDHPLAKSKSVTLTDCAAYPVLTLHDRWLIDAIMNSEFARSGARFNARIISNSIELMRQAILAGLGIGFFTPIGFIDEIKRGELMHIPLAEPWLADSELGILVPRSRSFSAPVRVALDVVRARLLELADHLSRTAPLKRVRVHGRRRGARGTPGIR